MKRFGWPRPPLLIGYVLAGGAETYLYQAVQFSGWEFFLRPIVVVIAILALWPSVAANAYMLSAGVIVLNYAVLATGWNIMGGFTGYVSLGHVAFFGLGSYGTALLVIEQRLLPMQRMSEAQQREVVPRPLGHRRAS